MWNSHRHLLFEGCVRDTVKGTPLIPSLAGIQFPLQYLTTSICYSIADVKSLWNWLLRNRRNLVCLGRDSVWVARGVFDLWLLCGYGQVWGYHGIVAAHCNAMQRTATHCNALQRPARQHAAAHCTTLHHTSTYCNTLQYTVIHWRRYDGILLKLSTQKVSLNQRIAQFDQANKFGLFLCVCVCERERERENVCVCVCLCVHIRVCIGVCTCINIHTCTCVYMYGGLSIHIYIYACIFMHVCIPMCLSMKGGL